MKIKAPKACREANWHFDPVVVNVPYRGYGKESVQLPALGAGFETLTATLDDDPHNWGIGWDFPEEKELLGRFKDAFGDVHEAVLEGTIHPSVAPDLMKILELAQDRINAVQDEYDAYLAGYPDQYPIDGSDGQYVPPWPKNIQAKTRAAIRKNVEEAGKLLHCALYGMAQSMSFNANRQAYQGEVANQKFAPPGEKPELGIQSKPERQEPSLQWEVVEIEEEPPLVSEPPPEGAPVVEPEEKSGMGLALAGLGALGVLALFLGGRK